MIPIQYHDLVRRAQMADLLADAERERLATISLAARSSPSLRESTMRVLCRVPIPALEPACAMLPA